MPGRKPSSSSKKGGGGGSKRNNNNSNTSRGPARGGKWGNPKKGRNAGKFNNSHGSGGGGKRKLIQMRPDRSLKEQPYEYIILTHAELALPCPVKALEDAKAAENTPTSQQQPNSEQQQQQTSTPIFDPKQIVQLACCVLHTPSGTVCGRFQSLVKPPPNTAPLSQYCVDVIGVTQKDVDAALPLVDVMQRAERWIRDVLQGRGDADTVFEFCKKVSTAAAANNDDDSSGSESDDEEGEEGSSDGDEDEEKGGKDGNKNDSDDAAAAATTLTLSSKIILGADGLPTIAAVFHGNQQFMPSELENNGGSDPQQQQSLKKQFSHLHALDGAIFDRWIDIREHFHRYFRVPGNLRLKFNDQLREIGLSYEGRSHHAADFVLNLSRLFVAVMKKGCVFGFTQMCRVAHEQQRSGYHETTPLSSIAGSASTIASGAAGAASSGPRSSNNSNNIQSLIANKADIALRTANSDLYGTPNSSGNGKSGGGFLSILLSAMSNEVFVRWIIFVVLLGGIAWNATVIWARG